MSFTAESTRVESVLKTPCVIFPAYNPAKMVGQSNTIHGKQYIAIWDTGATNSVISEKVIAELGLCNMGFTQVNHAGGQDVVPVYKVNIGLPNNVTFAEIKVTQGKLAGADVLIGMDIITKGDFSVTNVGGKTTFSFRVPSIETIDYVKESQKPTKPIVKEKQPGRNDPCPCGSGKKFKNCHGKGIV